MTGLTYCKEADDPGLWMAFPGGELAYHVMPIRARREIIRRAHFE